MDGILLLHKPQGVTSFQALAPVKRLAKGVKVGHCGTLDRFASGLLIVLLGRMTRLNPLFSGLDKSYHATFHFGYETETLDPEGAIVQRCPYPADLSLIRKEQFLGSQAQLPPVYSAIHIDGQRCSKMARKGHIPDLSARQICIHKLDIAGNFPDIQVDVTCSKGTYIRSLARDMGQRSCSCATVTVLERYWIGQWNGTREKGFFLEQAHYAQDIDLSRNILSAWQALQALPHVPVIQALPQYVIKIRQGQSLQEEWLDKPVEHNFVVVFDQDYQMLALIKKINEKLTYGFVVGEES